MQDKKENDFSDGEAICSHTKDYIHRLEEENDQLRTRVAELEARLPEVVTITYLSQDIEDWRFNDEHGGKFGEYLMNKYPNGLIITEG